MVGASASFHGNPMMAPSGAVSMHAELAGHLLLHRDRCDGHLRPLVHVEFEHFADVHSVNMVGAEDHHEMRIRLFNQIDVLINGVGGAAIPVLARGPHLRRNRDDEVLLQQAARLPAFAKMLQQALALELDQHVRGINP